MHNERRFKHEVHDCMASELTNPIKQTDILLNLYRRNTVGLPKFLRIS